MSLLLDASAPKKQGTYPGGLTATHPYTVHPLSPSPSFLGPGTSGVPPSKSSETPPQKTSQFDISSIPPIPASAVHQPLPPLPPPPTTAPDKPPTRPKQAKHNDSSRRAPKGDRPPAPAPPVVERKPLSLTNPPRKCIHHGKILQIINSTTVKDRYLFLFNDILLIVKHMSEGSPTLESRFQVKDVIELKTISISLTRDKYDPKNGLTGTHSNRKISPILAEFIHTFDQEPEEAIRKFVQKRALHPDSTSVAHLLFKTPELSKSQLALFFSRQANKYVYRSFLDQCQFAGVLLDEALRILLTRLCLPDRIGAHRTGGPSERTLNRVDYLLEEFTRRWYEANANVIVFDASIAHKLVIAMIVLNAQLHHNEGASIVKDREEVGILIRPRIGSQPSTPTIASVPVMDSNLAVPLTTTAQLYMTLELDDLSAFPRPTKESFVESFQHLDQQRIVPRDILHNIYLSISHQPLDIDSDRLSVSTPNPTSSTGRKLPPIMIFPATLPPRLTLKIASDPITITIPTPNPHFSIHLSGKDLKCEPPVLEFGSHRSQLFRITGLAPGRRTLTIQPRIATDKGTVEQYYDMKNLPYKQSIAIERQFMRHTFQISMLNDLGRRRYLFGASTAAEKDEWARVLSHYLHMAKGQNAARLNEHTGLEKSIGLQILKELLLGVDASDQDENEDAVEPSETKVPPEPIPVPTPVVPPPTMGLGIPFEGHLSGNGVVPARSAANAGSSTATTAGHHSPKLGSGANTEWPSSHGSNGTTSSKDSWMCRMPKPGAKVPDRKGSELIQLVEQNSLMELVLGFMRDISRDRVRRMEEKEQRMAAKAQVETDEGYEEDEGYDVDDMDEGVEDDEEEEDELAPLASSNVLGSFAAGVAPPVEIIVEQAPETKKRFSGWPRSAAMLAAAKKNAGRSPTIPEDQSEKPKEQQEQEKTKVQEQQKCTTSTITEQVEEEEEEDEERAVSSVSGKAHMVKGKETWYAHQL
ncbi:MAG: hypothetical protein J3Q66DRAFT_335409 [Benniella sp.]|nr:MAG: hypothetical protein J3Q66DRAFT_335409 [Benniella sp.]